MDGERKDKGRRSGQAHMTELHRGKPIALSQDSDIPILQALVLPEQVAWIQDSSRGREREKAKGDRAGLKMTGLAI